jgi:hypothetical protein
MPATRILVESARATCLRELKLRYALRGAAKLSLN